MLRLNAILCISLLFLSSCATTGEPNPETQTHCQLHGVPLQADTVPVIYGLVRFDPDYLKAWRTTFPNAATSVLGGCITSDGDDKTMSVKYCPACREAKNKWLLAHGVETAQQRPASQPAAE